MLASKLLSPLQIAMGVATAVVLSACQTPTPRVSSVVVPRLNSPAPPDAASALAGKEFVTTSDWVNGAWVVKKGAKISFRPDGFGSFSARVFTVQRVPLEELQFQAAQYGKDGNELFLSPAAALGLAIQARHPYRDYPVDLNFGFDARHFQYIEKVKFMSRIKGGEKTLEKSGTASFSGSRSLAK